LPNEENSLPEEENVSLIKKYKSLTQESVPLTLINKSNEQENKYN